MRLAAAPAAVAASSSSSSSLRQIAGKRSGRGGGRSDEIELDQDEDKDCQGDEGEEEEAVGYLSDLCVRPEVEALLRSIFRRLDANDSGCVSRDLLLACLSDMGDDGVEEKKNAIREGEGQGQEEGLLEAHEDREEVDDEGGEDPQGDVLPLGILVREAAGYVQWRNLVQGLRVCSLKQVTWGELLLQLLPTPLHHEARGVRVASALDGDDLEALQAQGAWGDAEWGLVPLDLSSLLTTAAAAALPSSSPLARQHQHRKKGGATAVTRSSASASSAVATTGGLDAREEMRRLRDERAFLMHRLQVMPCKNTSTRVVTHALTLSHIYTTHMLTHIHAHIYIHTHVLAGDEPNT